MAIVKDKIVAKPFTRTFLIEINLLKKYASLVYAESVS